MNRKEDYISHLNDLNKEISFLIKEKNEISNKIKEISNKENEDLLKRALIKNDWFEILKIREEDIGENQRKVIEEYIKPVNKLVSISGHFNESRQVCLKLTLIDYSYNQNQIDKLLKFLQPIINGMIPVSIDNTTKKYKVFPILDSNKGEKGSYSLIIDQFNRASIFLNKKDKAEVVSIFSDLRYTLTFIAKNIPYHKL